MITGPEGFTYYEVAEGVAKTTELLRFISTNPGLYRLLPSLIQQCRNRVNASKEEITDARQINQRLASLQTLIEHKFGACKTIPGAVRRLTEGVSITLAAPSIGQRRLDIHQPLTGLVPSARVDLARHTELSYRLKTPQAQALTGIQLVLAYGITEVAANGKIGSEDLDGVMMFFTDNGVVFGAEAKFHGPGLSIPQTTLPFGVNSQKQAEQINQVITGLKEISFLQRP